MNWIFDVSLLGAGALLISNALKSVDSKHDTFASFFGNVMICWTVGAILVLSTLTRMLAL